jgi:hypothetical protein
VHGAGRDEIRLNDPIRLERAAALAFPEGSMTAAILRKEAQRGNLDIMRIGGRLFTTLADIEEMKRRCRLSQRPRLWFKPGTEGRKASASPDSGSSRTMEGPYLHGSPRFTSRQASEEAQDALAKYIIGKRKVPRERDRAADQVSVADVIAIYMQDRAPLQARRWRSSSAVRRFWVLGR